MWFVFKILYSDVQRQISITEALKELGERRLLPAIVNALASMKKSASEDVHRYICNSSWVCHGLQIRINVGYWWALTIQSTHPLPNRWATQWEKQKSRKGVGVRENETQRTP